MAQVTVATFSTTTEAQMAARLLTDAGLDAVVAGDDCSFSSARRLVGP